MKVLISHQDISTPGGITYGGIAALYQNLAIELHKLGCQVSVITAREWNYPGIQSIKLEKTKSLFSYAETVKRAVKQIQPDIAECSNYKGELLAFAQLKQRDCKVICRCDPSSVSLFDDLILGKFEKQMVQQADYRIAVSHFSKRDIEKMYSVPVETVIHNGVEDNVLRYQAPQASKVKQLLIKLTNSQAYSNLPFETISELLFNKTPIFWIGKPTKMKGYDLLLEVIRKSSQDICFVLNLGKARTKQLELPEGKNIILVSNLTKQDQISSMSLCKVGLVTSRIEGFCISAAEYLALGIPVLLNNECQAAKEFILDGVDGLYFNPEKEPDISEKVHLLCSQKFNRMQIANRIKRFNWQTNARQTLKIYKELTT